MRENRMFVVPKVKHEPQTLAELEAQLPQNVAYTLSDEFSYAETKELVKILRSLADDMENGVLEATGGRLLIETRFLDSEKFDLIGRPDRPNHQMILDVQSTLTFKKG